MSFMLPPPLPPKRHRHGIDDSFIVPLNVSSGGSSSILPTKRVKLEHALSFKKDALSSAWNKKTHILFTIDASRSMSTQDVCTNKNKKKAITRWEAVFDCVQELLQDQLQFIPVPTTSQQNKTKQIDIIVSLVIFNDTAETILERVPLEIGILQTIRHAQTKYHPHHGTNFSAGLSQAVCIANGGDDATSPNDKNNDSLVLIFLSDGRPGDLRSRPPTNSGEMKLHRKYRRDKQTFDSAIVHLEKLQNTFGSRFSLQVVCLSPEATPWLNYLSKQFGGTLFSPNLSIDTGDDYHLVKPGALLAHDDIKETVTEEMSDDDEEEEEEILEMKVKSQDTLLHEKFSRARHAGAVDSIQDSSLRSTFQSISSTVTAVRSSNLKERCVVLESIGYPSPMVQYHATRMVLDVEQNRIAIAIGETPDARTVQVASRPFAQGGLRNVYRMLETIVGGTPKKLVGKESRHEVEYRDRLHFHCESSMCQAKAFMYANAFNNATKAVANKMGQRFLNFQIKVVRAEVYRLKDASSPGGFRYLAVEDEITGPYVKWNSNNGYVHPCHSNNGDEKDHNDAAQAFSHFSYQSSHQREIVVDIQGSGYTYTDPQLHSKEKLYGRADRGESGFRDFFHTHKCNRFCLALGLKLST